MAAAAIVTSVVDATWNSAEHRTIWYKGAHMTLLTGGDETNGQFALVEVESDGPADGPPKHYHEREDELFYVLEGQLTVTRGDETITVQAGQSAFLPRLIPHTFHIDSAHARALVLVSPAGFENFFWEMGQPVEKGAAPSQLAYDSIAHLIETAGRYGVRFLPAN